MEQTYQVPASATKPQSVRPPFPAHGLTATNNATVLVTIASDQGDTFVLTPGQSKTQGYRGSPGQWTVTATSDGPGSVALSFTDQFTAGDATPQNVAQAQSGNQHYAFGPGYGDPGSTPRLAGPVDTSGAQFVIVVFAPVGTGNGATFQTLVDYGLPSEIDSPEWNLPGGWYSFCAVRHGRGGLWPLGQNIAALVIGNPSDQSWGVKVDINIFGA